MPCSSVRSSTVRLASSLAIRAAVLAVTKEPAVPLECFSRFSSTAANAAAVPEVAITVLMRAAMILFDTRPNSRSINPCNWRNSFLRGGSWCRNSLVRRTAPKGTLTVSRIWPRTEMVSSQLPPPKSTISAGQPEMRRFETSPKWMRRASSAPEMTSTVHPVTEWTQSINRSRLWASRSALVATTRTASTPYSCEARWKRRRTLTVSDMESGESTPPGDLKTNSPSRVTCRSSCMTLRRRRTRRAIFNRTELAPISTAAKVGITQGVSEEIRRLQPLPKLVARRPIPLL